MEEVIGSNPLFSTLIKEPRRKVRLFFLVLISSAGPDSYRDASMFQVLDKGLLAGVLRRRVRIPPPDGHREIGVH